MRNPRRQLSLHQLESRIAPTNTPPELVRDIHTGPASSDPVSLLAIDGVLYFTANDGYRGQELWKTDGKSTELVRDIYTGQTGSSPSNFVNLNGTLIFLADDGINGRELWRSDGTSSGTQLIKNINTSTLPVTKGFSYTTFEHAVVGSTLFFAGNTPGQGIELWKTDGTESGTTLVLDIYAGFTGSSPQSMVEFNGMLYFSALTSFKGRVLWRSDGTSSGTQQLENDIFSPSISVVANLTNVNGTLFFTASDTFNGNELWRTDGTSTGTKLVRDIAPLSVSAFPVNLMNSDGVLFFTAREQSNTGPILYKSDGTYAGTVPVRNINSKSANPISNETNFATRDGILYFAANDGVNGIELWRTDGTSTGTFMVRDLLDGSGSGIPNYLTLFNNDLYFVATSTAHGREVFRSDGTSSGTVPLLDIAPGTASAHPLVAQTPFNLGLMPNLAEFDGRLYFQGNGGNGLELWRSDGTSTGTSQASVIAVGNASSNPITAIEFQGKLAFAASEQSFGVELWLSDGTSSGTNRLADIAAGDPSSSPASLFNMSGQLFFSAFQSAQGRELWTSDGTANGTQLVRDINPGTTSGLGTQQFAALHDKLYLAANGSGTGTEFWRSDGTSSGTLLVRDINPGSASSFPLGAVQPLVESGDVLYFPASNGSSLGTELWKTDGTSSGTMLVRDINPGTSSSITTNFQAVNFQGMLLFAATDGTNGTELWRSDGTSSGTVLVADLAAGSTSSNPALLTVIGDWVYFSASTAETGRELWRTDGSKVELVSDIQPGSGSSSPGRLWNANGTLYFSANDGAGGTVLWRSDGTSSGTVLVYEFLPGDTVPVNFALSNLANIGDILFFSAPGPDGTELWRSDGTSAGTKMIDIEPGFPGNANTLRVIGDHLYFNAFRSDVGMELFTLRELSQPAVSSLLINQGDTQRSRIVSIEVQFDSAQETAIFQNPGAITLTRTQGGPSTVVTIGSGLVVTPGASTSTSIVLTFQDASLSGVDNSSLADGRWQLAIPSINYTSMLNDPNLRRLFGDANNDGTVDSSDFALFGSAFGGSGVAFDFDNNGTVDSIDFAEFGSRFGVSL